MERVTDEMTVVALSVMPYGMLPLPEGEALRLR